MYITIDNFTYDDIVAKHRLTEPTTEDVIYGDELENGMRVLVESACRYDDRVLVVNEIAVTNRWCVVTKLRKKEGEKITFVGLYDNDERHVRTSAASDGWVVKLDSIPIKMEG